MKQCRVAAAPLVLSLQLYQQDHVYESAIKLNLVSKRHCFHVQNKIESESFLNRAVCTLLDGPAQCSLHGRVTYGLSCAMRLTFI